MRQGYEPLSIGERRRRAPLHYWARANNAHFAARILWSASEEGIAAAVESTGYGGAASIALAEAFSRESSASIELIVKAVIAQRIELGMARSHVVRVRTTHDIPSLWMDAELPSLSPEDQRVLISCKWSLEWAGRYPAPTTDEAYGREMEEMDKVDPPRMIFGTAKLRKGYTPEWEDFNRVYLVAQTSLFKMRNEAGI